MKKLFMFVLAFAVVLSLSGVAMAEEAAAGDGEDRVVGDDIDIADDEMKIVSIEDDPDRVVGDDIDIADDEMKIVSIDDDSDRVVGDDLELGEDEAGIVSVDDEAEDRVVGDDLELGEDEAGIVSVDDEAEDDSKLPMAAIISGAVLIAAGLVFLLKRVL